MDNFTNHPALPQCPQDDIDERALEPAGSISGSGEGSGAFERFLTSAIATILTIIFSWRILMDRDPTGTPARRSLEYSRLSLGDSSAEAGGDSPVTPECTGGRVGDAGDGEDGGGMNRTGGIEYTKSGRGLGGFNGGRSGESSGVDDGDAATDAASTNHHSTVTAQQALLFREQTPSDPFHVLSSMTDVDTPYDIFADDFDATYSPHSSTTPPSDEPQYEQTTFDEHTVSAGNYGRTSMNIVPVKIQCVEGAGIGRNMGDYLRERAEGGEEGEEPGGRWIDAGGGNIRRTLGANYATQGEELGQNQHQQHEHLASTNSSSNSTTEKEDIQINLEAVREQYNRMVRQAQKPPKSNSNIDPRYVNSSDSDDDEDNVDGDGNGKGEQRASNSEDEDSESDESFIREAYPAAEYAIGECDSSDSEYYVVFKRVLEVITEEETDDLDVSSEVHDIPADEESCGSSSCYEYNPTEAVAIGDAVRLGIHVVNSGGVGRGGRGVGGGRTQGTSLAANTTTTNPQQQQQQQKQQQGGTARESTSNPRSGAPQPPFSRSLVGRHETARDDNKNPQDGGEGSYNSENSSSSSDELTCVTASILSVHRDGRATSLDFIKGVASGPWVGGGSRPGSSRTLEENLTGTPGEGAAATGAAAAAVEHPSPDSSSSDDHSRSDSRLTGSTLTITSSLASRDIPPGGEAATDPGGSVGTRGGLPGLGTSGEWSDPGLTSDTNSIDAFTALEEEVNPQRLLEAERARRYGGFVNTHRPVTIGPYHDRLSEFSRRNYIGIPSPPQYDSYMDALKYPGGHYQGNHGDPSTTGVVYDQEDGDKHGLISGTDKDADNTGDNNVGSLYWMPDQTGVDSDTTTTNTDTSSTLAPGDVNRCSINVVPASHLQGRAITPEPSNSDQEQLVSTTLSSSEQLDSTPLSTSEQFHEHHDDYLHTQYYTHSASYTGHSPYTTNSVGRSSTPSHSHPPSSLGTLTDQEYDTAEDTSSSGRYRTPEGWSGVDSGEEQQPPWRKREKKFAGEKTDGSIYDAAVDGSGTVHDGQLKGRGGTGEVNDNEEVVSTGQCVGDNNVRGAPIGYHGNVLADTWNSQVPNSTAQTSTTHRPLNVGLVKPTGSTTQGSYSENLHGKPQSSGSVIHESGRGDYSGVTNDDSIGSMSSAQRTTATSKLSVGSHYSPNHSPTGFHGDSSAAMENNDRPGRSLLQEVDYYGAPINSASPSRYPGGNQAVDHARMGEDIPNGSMQRGKVISDGGYGTTTSTTTTTLTPGAMAKGDKLSEAGRFVHDYNTTPGTTNAPLSRSPLVDGSVRSGQVATRSGFGSAYGQERPDHGSGELVNNTSTSSGVSTESGRFDITSRHSTGQLDTHRGKDPVLGAEGELDHSTRFVWSLGSSQTGQDIRGRPPSSRGSPGESVRDLTTTTQDHVDNPPNVKQSPAHVEKHVGGDVNTSVLNHESRHPRVANQESSDPDPGNTSGDRYGSSRHQTDYPGDNRHVNTSPNGIPDDGEYPGGVLTARRKENQDDEDGSYTDAQVSSGVEESPSSFTFVHIKGEETDFTFSVRPRDGTHVRHTAEGDQTERGFYPGGRTDLSEGFDRDLGGEEDKDVISGGSGQQRDAGMLGTDKIPGARGATPVTTTYSSTRREYPVTDTTTYTNTYYQNANGRSAHDTNGSGTGEARTRGLTPVTGAKIPTGIFYRPEAEEGEDPEAFYERRDRPRTLAGAIVPRRLPGGATSASSDVTMGNQQQGAMGYDGGNDVDIDHDDGGFRSSYPGGSEHQGSGSMGPGGDGVNDRYASPQHGQHYPDNGYDARASMRNARPYQGAMPPNRNSYPPPALPPRQRERGFQAERIGFSPERQQDVRYAAIRKTADGSRAVGPYDTDFGNGQGNYPSSNSYQRGSHAKSSPTHGDYSSDRQTLGQRQYPSQYGPDGTTPQPAYEYAQVNRPGDYATDRRSWEQGDRAMMVPHSRTEPDLRQADYDREVGLFEESPLKSPRSCTALATSTALARKDTGSYSDQLVSERDMPRSVVSAIGNAEATGENPYIAVARATARAATIASANAAAGVAKMPQDDVRDDQEPGSDINVVISTSCTIKDENLQRLEDDGRDVINAMGNQPMTSYQQQMISSPRRGAHALPSAQRHQQLQQQHQRSLSREESLDGPKKMVITIEQEGKRGGVEKRSRTVECEIPQNPQDADLTRVISSAVKRILKTSTPNQRRDVTEGNMNDVIERVTRQVVQAYTTGEVSMGGAMGSGAMGSGARPQRTPPHYNYNYPYKETYTSPAARSPFGTVTNEAVPAFRSGPHPQRIVDRDTYREMHKKMNQSLPKDDNLSKYAVPVNSYGQRLQYTPTHSQSAQRQSGERQDGSQSSKDPGYFYVTGTGPGKSPGQVGEVVLKVVPDEELNPTVEHVLLSETESGSEAGTPLPARRHIDANRPMMDTVRENQHQQKRQQHHQQQQQRKPDRPQLRPESRQYGPAFSQESDSNQPKIKGILRTSPRYETQEEIGQYNSFGSAGRPDMKPTLTSTPREKKPYESILLQPVKDKKTPVNIAKRYESPERQPTEQKSKLEDARKGYLDMVPKNPPWPSNTILDAAFEEKKKRWYETSREGPSSPGLMVVDIDIDQTKFENQRAKSQSSEELKKRLSSTRLKAPSSSHIDQKWQTAATLKPYKSQGNLLDKKVMSGVGGNQQDYMSGRQRNDSTGSTTSTSAADLRRVRSLGTLPSQFFQDRRSYTSLMETDLDTGICTTTPLVYETDLDQVRPGKAKSLTNLSMTPAMVPIDIDEDRRKSMDTLPGADGQGLMYSLPADDTESSHTTNSSGLDSTQERSLSAGELRITQSLNKLSIPDWYRSSFGKGKKPVELSNTRSLREASSGELLDSSFDSRHHERKPPTPPRPIVIQHRVSNTIRVKSPANSTPTTPVDTNQQFELPSARLKHTHVELKLVETKPIQNPPVQIPKKQSAKEAYLRLKAQSHVQKEMLSGRPKTYHSEKTVTVDNIPAEAAEWYVTKSYISLSPTQINAIQDRERSESTGNDSGLGPSPGHDSQPNMTPANYDPGATCTELIQEMRLTDSNTNQSDNQAQEKLHPDEAYNRMLDNLETSRREIQEKAHHITTDKSIPDGLLNRGEEPDPKDCFPVLSYAGSPTSARKRRQELDSFDSDTRDGRMPMSSSQLTQSKDPNGSSSLDQVIGGLLAIPNESSSALQSPRSEQSDADEEEEDPEDMSPKSRVFRMLRQATTPRGSMVSVNTSKTQEYLSDPEDSSDKTDIPEPQSTSIDSKASEEDAVVKCRNPKCKKSAKLQDARKSFKTCHNCYTYYCSRDCRKAHWERHKRKCLFSRVNSVCKHIVRKIHDTQDLLEDISRVARTGYMSKGRGCVLLAFSSPEKAEVFLDNSQLETPPGYANLSDLQQETDLLGEHQFELNEMCKTYNPEIKFVVEIAIVSGQEVPAYPVPRREGPAIKKCARLRLSTTQPKSTTVYPKNEPETLILTALPGSEFSENMEAKKAREICFVNIQRKLRQRGVSLRHHFPEVYQKLCAYVSDNAHFTPMTIYPLDVNTGKRFMCLIMPNAEAEVEWMYNPDLLDELGLATQV